MPEAGPELTHQDTKENEHGVGLRCRNSDRSSLLRTSATFPWLLRSFRHTQSPYPPSTENYEVWPCQCAHLVWEQGWLRLLLLMGLRLPEAAVSVWHHLAMLPGHFPDPKCWLIIPDPDLYSSTLTRDKLLKVSHHSRGYCW